MQFLTLSGLVLVVILAFFASRPTIEFPVSPNLLDLYKRLELKLFETEKLRDPPDSSSEDEPVGKGGERTNAQLEPDKHIGHLLNGIHGRQLHTYNQL
ncbi:hypothetical protein AAVH_42014 [Aphelenchoides avenae]|nr:hypothetical protein AAVH_42014 [Aphelenchus avenae]